MVPGVKNDFCRMMTRSDTTDKGELFFACALAGTTVSDTTQFRTESVKDGFRISRDDYMRDIIRDGRDAYCRILILSRQLGRVNYFSDQQTKELLDLKKRLGYDDVRFHNSGAPMCGESSFDNEYSQFVPRPFAFRRENEPAGVGECQCKTSSQGSSCGGVTRVPQAVQQPRSEADFEKLVQTITNQVLGAMGG